MPVLHLSTHHVRGDLPVLAELLWLHQLLRNRLASLQKENGAGMNTSWHVTSLLLQCLGSRTGLLTFLRSVVSTVALS